MSDSLRPHGLQHAWLPCLSPTPGACSNSCPSSWWYRPTISSSVAPFFYFQSSPASGWTDNQSTCPKKSWAIYCKDQINWCFKSSALLPFSTGGPPQAQALKCRPISYSRQVASPSSASVHLCSGYSNSAFLIMLLVRFDALTCMRARFLHLCPTLCHPVDCSLPGSRMLQARILEWVAILSPGDLLDPGIEPGSLELQGRFFTIWATREAALTLR